MINSSYKFIKNEESEIMYSGVYLISRVLINLQNDYVAESSLSFFDDYVAESSLSFFDDNIHNNHTPGIYFLEDGYEPCNYYSWYPTLKTYHYRDEGVLFQELLKFAFKLY